jgi:hypothetical protein
MENKYKVLIGIAVFLIVLRLLLPYIALSYANDALGKMKGYYGHIDDIDIYIFRGAYTIKKLVISKIDPATREHIKFFRSRKIDLSLEWGSLIHGSFVGKLLLQSPELIFTRDKMELKDIMKEMPYFQKAFKDLMPLKVNRFEVQDGSIHYTDSTTKPKVDIFLDRAHILAFNLSNITNDKSELPSSVTAQASVYEGDFKLDMKINPIAVSPTFDLNAELTNVNLALLNDFLRAYGKFDISSGRIGLYSEMTAKDGKFLGYIKPLVTGLKVTGPNVRHDTFLKTIWENLIGAAGFVFKNQKKDQLATKIKIEGDFTDPEANPVQAIMEVLLNAFVQPLVPNVDNEINISSIKTEKVEKEKVK